MNSVPFFLWNCLHQFKEWLLSVPPFKRTIFCTPDSQDHCHMSAWAKSHAELRNFPQIVAFFQLLSSLLTLWTISFFFVQTKSCKDILQPVIPKWSSTPYSPFLSWSNMCPAPGLSLFAASWEKTSMTQGAGSAACRNECLITTQLHSHSLLVCAPRTWITRSKHLQRLHRRRTTCFANAVCFIFSPSLKPLKWVSAT